jgi:hypothetical protein
MDPRHPRRADPAGKATSKVSIVALAVALLAAMALVLALFLRDDDDDQRQRFPARSQVSAVLATSLAKGEPPAERSPPPLPASPVAEAPAGTPDGPHTTPPLDEHSLVSRLRDLAAWDPPSSLALAREALARFPRSTDAPEFEWNVVKALANMDRYSEAEREARTMVERFPGNPFTDDVERHVLNHPPNPVNVPDP